MEMALSGMDPTSLQTTRRLNWSSFYSCYRRCPNASPDKHGQGTREEMTTVHTNIVCFVGARGCRILTQTLVSARKIPKPLLLISHVITISITNDPFRVRPSYAHSHLPANTNHNTNRAANTRPVTVGSTSLVPLPLQFFPPNQLREFFDSLFCQCLKCSF